MAPAVGDEEDDEDVPASWLPLLCVLDLVPELVLFGMLPPSFEFPPSGAVGDEEDDEDVPASWLPLLCVLDLVPELVLFGMLPPSFEFPPSGAVGEPVVASVPSLAGGVPPPP
jgi:hypothetical protein